MMMNGGMRSTKSNGMHTSCHYCMLCTQKVLAAWVIQAEAEPCDHHVSRGVMVWRVLSAFDVAF